MARSLTVVGAALLVLLAGCSTRQEAASQAAPTAAALRSPEQHQRDRTRVLQTIRTMTPEQRAAYFKDHPEDAAALAP